MSLGSQFIIAGELLHSNLYKLNKSSSDPGWSLNMSNGTKIRLGILGCAKVAEKHAIPALKQMGNMDLVCISSRDQKKAKEWASKYGISYEASYERLLSRDDIDAVYIPLATGLHEEWVIKSAEAKKHILCEKSLSGSFQSVKNMIAACRANGVVLQENLPSDLHPQHTKINESIKRGDIGKPFVFKGYYGFSLKGKTGFRYDDKLGGGSLNDAGAYPVYSVRKLFGEEPEAVTSNLMIDPETNVDVQGTAYLEFRGGKSGFVAFGFNTVYQNNHEIWGTKGLIKVNRAYSIPADMAPSVVLVKNDTNEVITPIEAAKANMFELSFNRFSQMILDKNNKDMENEYASLLNQAKVLEAMRISAKENRKVRIEEIS